MANITDVNDKIYAAALQAGIGSAELAREMTAAYVADTDALGLGRPDHEPLASETIGPIVELIERLVEGGHAYAAEGDVYFSVRSYPNYGELSHRTIDQMDQGEGGRGRRAQARPARLRPVEGPQGGRGHLLGLSLGAGTARLAHRVLGDGRGAAGGRTSRSTAAAATCCSPTTRTRRPRPCAARGEPLARLWMHNGMVRLDSDKMSKSVGQRVRAPRGARSATAATRCSCTSAAPTTASRSSSTTSGWPRRGRGARGSARRRAALTARSQPRLVGAAPGAVLRRAGRRLQHPAGAGGGVRLGPGGQPQPGRDGGRRRSARDARRARAREPARARRTRSRPRRGQSSCLTPASAPGPTRDFAEADRLRDAARGARLGGPRRAGWARAAAGTMSSALPR